MKARRWILPAAILAAVVSVLLWQFRDLFRLLGDEAFRARFISWIDNCGPMGIPILFLFQAFQIMIAFLPGGLVELASGMLYGPFIGVAVSLCGILLGTFCAVRLAGRLGARWVRKMFDPAAFDRYAALCKSRKFTSFALLLFFLPGVPKDILIYALGVSGSLTLRFILLATLMRIPSVAVAVIAGSAFGDGQFFRFAVIYLSFLAVGLLGALIHRFLMNRVEHSH